MGDHRLATPDLNRIFRGETVSGLSEWQLLERYLEARDEVAFEALVARHGPMVLGVCRRMLADHDRRRRRVSSDVSGPGPPGTPPRSA